MSNYILIFMLGSAIASFLNVVAKATPIHQHWRTKRSACPHCQTTLTPRQLIPILSFLLQKGRCKSCHKPISPLYLLAEIVGGLLFISPLLLLSPTPRQLIQAWLFFSLLLTVTLTDLYDQRIPNKILIAFGLPLFLMRQNLHAAIIGFLFFYSASLIGKIVFKKDTLGGGDIKLYFVIGLVLSVYPLFLSILISSTLALIYAILWAKNQPIPFAPFITFGAIIAYFMSLH